jgi:hypothetical protein
MKGYTLLALVALTGTASAAPPVPADDAFVPWRCKDGSIASDPQGDDPPDFLGDLDLVGERTATVASRASDDDYLYLRIRLDEDPAPGGVPNPGGAWGVELDLDGDLRDYELLIMADARPAQPVVAVYTNQTVTQANSPLDPADAPAARSYAFADAAASVATSTTYGGTPDYFLDIVVPWADLEPLGLHPDTFTRVWVASSSRSDALDGDFMCHAPGDGDSLDGRASRGGTSDGDDTGGGGGGPRLEGGGGCDTGRGAGVAGLAWLALVLRRRRRG